MKFYLLLILLSLSTQANEFWFKPVGGKLLIGQKMKSTTLEFDSDKLELFCKKSEIYLDSFIKEYDSYNCSDDRPLTSSLCKVITDHVSRYMSGPRDFTTDQPNDYKVHLNLLNEQNADIDYGSLEEEFGINRRDFVFVKDRIHGNAPWDISVTSPGYFTKAMEITKSEYAITNTQDYALEGIVDNRYLACAILRNEVNISKELKLKTKVIERYDQEKLSTLYKLYTTTKFLYEEVDSIDQDDYLSKTLKGGIILNNLIDGLPKEEAQDLSPYELAKVFFTIGGLDNGPLRIELNEYVSKRHFETSLYPPKIHMVDYTTIFTSEE